MGVGCWNLTVGATFVVRRTGEANAEREAAPYADPEGEKDEEVGETGPLDLPSWATGISGLIWKAPISFPRPSSAWIAAGLDAARIEEAWERPRA